MSLLRFPGEQRSAINDLGDLSRQRSSTYSGQTVTADRAERHSAVWASLSAISETLIGLPLDEEVVQPDASFLRRDPPDVFYQPTPDLSWETWIWMQSWSLASHGRCNSLVTSIDKTGMPSTLVPVADSEVEWKWHKPTKMWVTKVSGEEMKRWPLGPLFHIGLYVKPGCPQGMSPIRNHAESIGVGLAAQQFGAQWFGDGGHPTVLVKTAKDPGVKGAAAILAKLKEATAGSREPIIVPSGTELERWQVSPDESQFLETMRYSGEDVARILGVRPGKIGLATSGSNVTYANITDANADWKMSGLLRYTRTFESALSRLTTGGRSRRLRFNYNEFLRPDAAARAAIYKVFADIGSLSGTPVMLTNEMRAVEGMRPLPGGDQFVRPGTSAVKVNDDGLLQVDDRAMRGSDGAYDAEKVAATLQKLYSAVDKVVTADEARSIVSTLGLDLSAAFVPPVVAPVVMRSEAPIYVTAPAAAPVTIAVDARQEPPVVNIDNRQQPVKAPVVNVTVEPPPTVRSDTVRRVERDGDGRITRLVDEET